MDDEPVRPKAYTLGDDLSRLSVHELDELREALLAEAERVASEKARKAATRDAAASVFKS
ncbi:MAG: DUF1192 domain-containing protein [Pseudomonadota bacterium]